VKTLYFDTFAGISGDMTVGALLALGLPLESLRAELAKLPLDGYAISAEPRFVHGIACTQFHVVLEGESHGHGHGHGRHGHHGHHHGHGHRAHRDIRRMIEGSHLADDVKASALSIFAKLALAEGRVHGVDPDDVRFHEVGAVDSIVDIVGAAIGFAHFGVQRFCVGTIPLGRGIVVSQHGSIPVPGPATVELLAGFVTRPDDGDGELVTPTGAAILAAVAEPSAPAAFQIEAVGYGAGTKVLADRPNLLRLVLGEAVVPAAADDVVVIETNVDDASPELFEHVMERLFEAGAKDVFLTPIVMKKSRPAVQVSVLCAPHERERLASLLLAETTAIGVRYGTMRRTVLPREVREVATEFGTVAVKLATAPDGSVNIAPEYESCRRAALARGVPLKQVLQAAIAAARA